MARRIGVLSLLALAVALAVPVRAADQPDVAHLFSEIFMPNFNKSCISSAKAGNPNHISDAKIAAYCNCVGKGMTDGFSDDEKQEMMQTSAEPSPAVQQKLDDIVEQCRGKLR